METAIEINPQTLNALPDPSLKIIADVKFSSFGMSMLNSYDQTKIIMPISIEGNTGCTGRELEASLIAAATSFGSVSAIIFDEIFKYNLQKFDGEDNLELLQKEAIQKGFNFINANLSAFYGPLKKIPLAPAFNAFQEDIAKLDPDKQLSEINSLYREHQINIRLFHYLDWINELDPHLAKLAPSIKSYLSSEHQDAILRKTLVETAEDYIKRKQVAKNPINAVSVYSNSDAAIHANMSYLLEEAIVFIDAAKKGYNFIAYPGKMPSFFRLLIHSFIKEYHCTPEKDEQRIKLGRNIRSFYPDFFGHIDENAIKIDPKPVYNILHWANINYKYCKTADQSKINPLLVTPVFGQDCISLKFPNLINAKPLNSEKTKNGYPDLFLNFLTSMDIHLNPEKIKQVAIDVALILELAPDEYARFFSFMAIYEAAKEELNKRKPSSYGSSLKFFGQALEGSTAESIQESLSSTMHQSSSRARGQHHHPAHSSYTFRGWVRGNNQIDYYMEERNRCSAEDTNNAVVNALSLII